ncbi:MAG: hypothetical protein M3342_08475 [Bacteroidota bacterium]|nr:hypothetical protein [Flavisolibacter sp.]MDQ3844033.1 hypothetical protein [Bacteroidota bacterium]
MLDLTPTRSKKRGPPAAQTSLFRGGEVEVTNQGKKEVKNKEEKKKG